jgi:beta-propeller uncharacterized protein DUF5122
MSAQRSMNHRPPTSVFLMCLVAIIWIFANCSSGDSATPPTALSAPDGGEDGGSLAFPQVNDLVFAMVSDGAGGVYVGGRFTRVGTMDRPYLAHITANGTVDPSWNPIPDGPVTALLLQGPTLYIGGNFLNMNGEERWRLAAVDGVTGKLTAWNPRLGAANLVDVLASSGTVIYVGGVFDLINATIIPGAGLRGEGRRNLAAVDTGIGLATPWNPNVPNGEVMALSIAGSGVYAGGSFDQVGILGQDIIRLNLAAFDQGSGVATPWNPVVRGIDGDVVSTLNLSGNVVYVGGRFSRIGGQARDNLAALDRESGLALSWNLPTSNTVSTLFDDGRRLYVGGLFTMIGGQPRGRLAAVDKATGLLTSWNPNADGAVRAIVVSNGKVFVGGDFTTIAGRPQSMFAVIDAETGLVVGTE